MPQRRFNTVLAVLELLHRAYPGLSMGPLRALLYVAENPGLSTSELAELCGVTLATASRTVRALAGPDIARSLPPSLGLVRLVRLGEDRRLVTVELSEAGRLLCRRFDQLIADPRMILSGDALRAIGQAGRIANTGKR
jgi:DNA-binding MarR family transcriptional regulator